MKKNTKVKSSPQSTSSSACLSRKRSAKGIMIRPIFYYSSSISNTLKQGISSFGNPLVWWLGIPAFIYIAYRFLFKKDRKAMFLTVGYLAELLPWVLVSRLTFIYHYFTSVPFVVLMNVYALSKVIEDNPKYKRYVCIYAVAIILVFFMFYPVLSGQTVNESYVKTWLRWVESWVLVSVD
jgi:dolichyl-phosphate-mannose--protein O-mannosyl transferase